MRYLLAGALLLMLPLGLRAADDGPDKKPDKASQPKSVKATKLLSPAAAKAVAAAKDSDAKKSDDEKPNEEKPSDEKKADPAQEEKPEPKNAAEAHSAAVSEFNDAMQAFSEKYQQAKDDEERQKIFSELYPQPEKFADKFMAVVEKYPDAPEAIDSLVWVLSNASRSDHGKKALNELKEKHFESDRIGQAISAAVYSGNFKDSEDFLKSVMEKSPHQGMQALATYSLAQSLKNKVETAGYLRSASEADLETYKKFYGEDFVDGLKTVDPAAVNAEVEKLYELVKEKYAEETTPFGQKLGDVVERELFEIRFLSVGKTAPEIEGEDLDSTPFKLSDYKGKVVVLDFWGNW